jgi:hypothetical protein
VEHNEKNREICMAFMDQFRYLGWPFKGPIDLNAYIKCLLDTFRDQDFTHPDYGKINDIEWVSKELHESCDRFPTIKDVRGLYCSKLMPWDKLQVYMEGREGSGG